MWAQTAAGRGREEQAEAQHANSARPLRQHISRHGHLKATLPQSSGQQNGGRADQELEGISRGESSQYPGSVRKASTDAFKNLSTRQSSRVDLRNTCADESGRVRLGQSLLRLSRLYPTWGNRSASRHRSLSTLLATPMLRRKVVRVGQVGWLEVLLRNKVYVVEAVSLKARKVQAQMQVAETRARLSRNTSE